MYALMITFHSSIPTADLVEPFTQYAEALRERPGLISKVWIQNGETLGGFHVFESKETADAYLASEMAAGLQATEGFDDFDVRGFDVLEELSAMTGVVARPPLSHSA
jgi:hypothetical protein